jgi:hypothetical protein
MSIDVHTVSFAKGGGGPSRSDRLIAALMCGVAFVASTDGVTAGSVTAGSGYTALPTFPADVNGATVVAKSLKSVGTPTVAAAGLGVAVNDTFDLVGGTLFAGGSKARVTATHIKAISATVVTGGTGGTPGAVTITGTTGTGTKFQATGVISAGGVLQGPLTVTVAGDYTANPTIAGDAVTGGGLSGATVALVMGALTFSLTTAGSYVVPPASPAALTDVVGTSTGVTATVLFGLNTIEVTNSGKGYSGAGAPTFNAVSADGNGSGASVLGTVGGNGNPMITFVPCDMPIPDAPALPTYVAMAMLNSSAAGAYVAVKEKTNLGFSVVVTPLSGGTLAAGAFDAIVLG